MPVVECSRCKELEKKIINLRARLRRAQKREMEHKRYYVHYDKAIHEVDERMLKELKELGKKGRTL